MRRGGRKKHEHLVRRGGRKKHEHFVRGGGGEKHATFRILVHINVHIVHIAHFVALGVLAETERAVLSTA